MPDVPRYRFHGSHQPTERTRTPLAFAPDATVDQDGVAKLRLYDPIDSWGDVWGVSAKEFVDVLDQLMSASEIRLHINSPGGEVYEGITIMNALRAHPARVVAVVDGLAASAASFVAVAADEVVMMPNSELMIHDAWGISIGPAETMREMADRLDSLSDNIASVYAAKVPDADWRAAMLAETWMSAEEAVAVGLADRIEGVASAGARNSFDLGQFRYAGRAQAPSPTITRSSAESDETAAEAPLRSARRLAAQAKRHQRNAKRA